MTDSITARPYSIPVLSTPRPYQQQPDPYSNGQSLDSSMISSGILVPHPNENHSGEGEGLHSNNSHSSNPSSNAKPASLARAASLRSPERLSSRDDTSGSSSTSYHDTALSVDTTTIRNTLKEEVATDRLAYYARVKCKKLASLRVWLWNIPLMAETLVKVIYEFSCTILKKLGEVLFGYSCTVDSQKHLKVLKCQTKAFVLQFTLLFVPSRIRKPKLVDNVHKGTNHENWGTQYQGQRSFWFIGNYYPRTIHDIVTNHFTAI